MNSVAERLRRLLESFYLFRLFILSLIHIGYAYCLVAVVAPRLPAGVNDVHPLLTMGRLAWAYWRERFQLAGLLFLAILLVIVTDPLRPLHEWLFRNEYALPRPSKRRARRLRFVTTILASLLLPGTALLVPAMHVFHRDYFIVAAWFLPLPLIVWSYVFSFVKEMPILKRTRAISRLNYSRMHFDAAGMGMPSDQASGEVRRYLELRNSHGPRAAETVDFLRSGTNGGLWRGYDDFFRSLARLVGDVDPHELELHDRTLDAMRRAVAEALQARPTAPLILTDGEYPAIIHVLEEEARRAKRMVVQARVREAMVRAPSAGAFARAIGDAVEECAEAPIVVLSHVYFTTGYVSNPVAVAERLRETHEDVIIVCDGAQALGHIPVTRDVVESVTYYCGCTHKWLMGKESLGILYRNGERIESSNIRVVRDASRSLSSLEDGIGSGKEGGTISFEPYITASVGMRELIDLSMDAVSKHNRELAHTFARGVERRAVGHCVGFVSGNGGIVVVRPSKPIEAVRNALARGKVYVPAVSCGTDASDLGLRFSFHYYHGQTEVMRLLEILEGA